MATGAQLLPLAAWFAAVNSTVASPYLDEEFHVRQAQHYCAGRWDVWDPKITTPPALYLLSSALSPLLGCRITALRALSALSLVLLLPVVVLSYALRQPPAVAAAPRPPRRSHSSLNVTLFPPLFFFAALYYTDVASTLSVLLFHCCHLYTHAHDVPAWRRIPALTALGVVCVAFRQTNVIWVTVFPAATVLVNDLDRGHPAVKDSMARGAQGFGDSWLSVAKTSWKMDVVYDPPVPQAWLEDYVKTTLSVVICALKCVTRPQRILNLLSLLAPEILIAASFVAFIVWNGSIVLGDKGNHVSTLHLPQMLYIWPYFTFFSWPILYPYLLAVPVGLWARLPAISPPEFILVFRRRHPLPRLSIVGAFVALAAVVVHFNTIVHPFILADNRHYTFYVFRLLMRPWWVKYAVTPVYIVCGWACIQAMGGAAPVEIPPNAAGASALDLQKGKEKKTTAASATRPLSLPDGANSATLSFVLIWLACTSLQLVTAPLVEPRYLILPWICWRLHLPLRHPDGAPTRPSDRKNTRASLAGHVALDPDFRLWLETAWHLAVNAATGYIFLNWGFTWPQEPGAVQRFLW